MSAADPGFGADDKTEGRLGTDNEPVPVPVTRGGYRGFYAGLAAALLRGGPLPVDPRDALEGIAIIESVHARMTA